MAEATGIDGGWEIEKIAPSLIALDAVVACDMMPCARRRDR
jgi:hypothetical protein